jgi:hypothetical protein
MTMPRTDQIELMRHALGHYRTPRVDRNYFAADPGSDDDKGWQELVVSGHARLYRPAAGEQTMNYYTVTPAGQLLVSQAMTFATTEG